MTLEEAREGIGRKVIYKSPPWQSGTWSSLNDRGVITSVNDRYVFVRYGSNTMSAATRPGDLMWLP